MRPFNLTILTLDKIVYEGEATALFVPGYLGYFEILKNHAPIISPLHIGKLTFTTEGKKRVFALSGGVIKVDLNKVVIIGDAMEEETEIDVVRAKEAEHRAYRRLEDPSLIDERRATQSLLRAKNRLQITDQRK